MGVACHIWDMVAVTLAAAIDVPLFGWVVVSVVLSIVSDAKMSKPSP